MEVFSDKKTSKNIKYFECKSCDFICSKKGDWNRHIMRPKHIKLTNSDVSVTEKTYVCDCGKEYRSRNGLWSHRKKCQFQQSPKFTEDKTQELIQYLMKENAEFKQLLIDQSKQMSEISCKAIDNAGHNHINSHNKTFNLQVFLNETCKNAINMSEFIDQLHVSISDLEETGKLGFAEGISTIFINGLKQMDVPDRPLHCSDLKRETIYIKNNNEWTKDTDENLLLVNAIKQVSNKNIKQISEWQKINPEWKKSSSKINDRYLKIVSESMSGTTKEECDKNYKKIVKNIAKETVIDKTIA